MTQAAQRGAKIVLVDGSERGKAITRRRLAHGFRSLREFAEAAGLSREAVTRAERGEASAGTYQRLESFLDQFDVEVGEHEPGPATDQRPPFVRFSVEGVYGAKALVIEGPVENLPELEAAVDRIMRRLQGEDNGEPHPSG